jgi:hypothetical protein
MKTNHTKPIGSSMFDAGSWSLRFTIHLPSSILVLLLPVLLALPAAGQAPFHYTTNVGTISHATFYGGNPVAFSTDSSDGKGNATNVDSTFADAVGNSPYPLRLPFTNSASDHRLPAPVNEWAVSQYSGEAGNEISYGRASQVRTEAGDKPAAIYSLGLELRPIKPINVVQSKAYPGIEYSGSLVQATRSNPLQLINPFAPAIYGNGEANTVLNPVTKAAEGLKLFQISF